jgi:hypothetical protein
MKARLVRFKFTGKPDRAQARLIRLPDRRGHQSSSQELGAGASAHSSLVMREAITQYVDREEKIDLLHSVPKKCA